MPTRQTLKSANIMVTKDIFCHMDTRSGCIYSVGHDFSNTILQLPAQTWLLLPRPIFVFFFFAVSWGFEWSERDKNRTLLVSVIKFYSNISSWKYRILTGVLNVSYKWTFWIREYQVWRYDFYLWNNTALLNLKYSLR